MAFIPGQLVSLATFPGVIVHEIAHQFFCRIFGIAVIDVCYFQFDNPAGYVKHEPAKHAWQHLIIGIGPFLINSIVGALIALPATIPVFKFGAASFFDYFLIWLGISIAMHAFPSTGDAANIWQEIKAQETPLWLKIIAAPLVSIIYLGALGSVLWLDLVYGIAVATLLPNLVILLLS